MFSFEKVLVRKESIKFEWAVVTAIFSLEGKQIDGKTVSMS